MSLRSFAKRIDDTPLRLVTTSELRTRIDLLKAELEQLFHDEVHVTEDLYGLAKFRHLEDIKTERRTARAKIARYTVELTGRI